MKDKELVESIGNSPGGKVLKHQAELLRRNTEALREFSKSSERYSRTLFFLTIVLVTIGLFQLVISVYSMPENNPYIRLGAIVLFPGLIIWLLHAGFKELDRQEAIESRVDED